jgi:hypothetical protein
MVRSDGDLWEALLVQVPHDGNRSGINRHLAYPRGSDPSLASAGIELLLTALRTLNQLMPLRRIDRL